MDLLQSVGEARTVALHQLAERCKRDLFFLVQNILAIDPDLITEHTHRELCEMTRPLLPDYDSSVEAPKVELMTRYKNDGSKDELLSDQFDPRRNKLLIQMPRGTFKSSIVTIGLTLQYILNDPNARILIDSETYSKAKNFLAEVKGHLEDNSKYREIFFTIHGCYPDDGKKNPSMRWTDSMVDLACRKYKRKEPSISCSGIDKSINGMHYDLIIMDDLHSEKNVTNKEQIEQVIDHYKLSFSLLDPGCPAIVIGTRWDYQDLYQYMLENERTRYNIIIRKAVEDDGSLLFPERLTNEFLDEQRKSQGNYIFSCQYLNSPVDDETATFKQSYFRHTDWDLVKDRPMNWFMSIDPSQEGPYSDYAAFVLAGIDHQQELYVRQVHRAKMNYSQIVNLMFEWYLKYKPRRIGLETIATQKGIEYILNDEQKKRGIWMPVEIIKSRTASKESRIEALAPYYEFGRVHHIKEANQIDELEYELLHFPKGSHDDVADALATILEIGTPPSGKRIGREQESRRPRQADKPRSPVTGI
jgi:predicted phage terminase large subunit-like protein